MPRNDVIVRFLSRTSLKRFLVHFRVVDAAKRLPTSTTRCRSHPWDKGPPQEPGEHLHHRGGFLCGVEVHAERVGKEKKRNRRKKIIKTASSDVWKKTCVRQEGKSTKEESDLKPNHYFSETLDMDSSLPLSSQFSNIYVSSNLV